MQRRKFIKDTLTGLPLLLMTPSILASSCNDKDDNESNDKKVIVVGGGISGLAAAKKLKDNGFDVVVLEAQDKVGGRLRTNRTLGFDFDEGASWIHGVDGNPITALAQQAGMNTFETIDNSRKSYDIGGVLRTASAYNNAEDELYTILNSMMNSGNATQSFETIFANLYPDKVNNRLWKFLLSTYVTFDCGDLNNLSSLLYNEGEEFGGAEKIATNGYDTLANFLANGLAIQCNERVSKIDYSNSKIKVTHNGVITEADYVLVTVPLGVLKANTIEFTPSLPNTKTNAIQKLGMNCVNKFLLTWDNAFWDDVQYISYTPEIKDKFNYFVNVKKINPNVNALMTFAYADYARQTESMSDAQIIDEIMLHLKDIYGNTIPNPTHLLRTKWQTNENSLGSYSYTAVSTEMHHFDDLAEEINDKVFFAGEHTEVDYFSTVHGAYLSGIREANKIIDLI
ncbi:monoamine oxidase [Flavobacterium croceum DSM 17960]|uniref:Tryptophan 2-monooxygenase n=1 Tax=Flavobacterium croceum DSM 17960 TaxID=1121886 RepID=A0A2S4NAJ8_9FLAO|nr:NAD(P)/FAD-dependent oxidoreductase [Flavobacterium croceum]POS02705.1 monoamine oxidase [Flavobacterium croceum DSM 17960]